MASSRAFKQFLAGRWIYNLNNKFSECALFRFPTKKEVKDLKAALRDENKAISSVLHRLRDSPSEAKKLNGRLSIIIPHGEDMHFDMPSCDRRSFNDCLNSAEAKYFTVIGRRKPKIRESFGTRFMNNWLRKVPNAYLFHGQSFRLRTYLKDNLIDDVSRDLNALESFVQD